VVVEQWLAEVLPSKCAKIHQYHGTANFAANSSNWRHKARIHAEEIKDFSLDSCGFFCRACKLRSSGFSIMVKKTMSTVARDMLGLNVEAIKLLKTLNLISGKGVVG
jgi:hypothetical protein